MKVNIAFKLFSDEVIKGLLVHRMHIESSYKIVQPTEEFIKKISRLIRVMTSRINTKALRPGSADARFLEEFVTYLEQWEQHAKPAGGAFLSKSTAAGFRVTLKSTLDPMEYLTSVVGFTYLLMSRLSQDKLENLFGLIRQSSGCNDHPTVSQFLTTVNLLTMCNFFKPPKGGNCSPEMINALLNRPAQPEQTKECLLDTVDDFLDQGKLSELEVIIQALFSNGDHFRYSEKQSNSTLIYYTAGYVARKIIAKNACPDCAVHLCVSRRQAGADSNSCFTVNFDNGGLIYPSQALALAVKLM